MQEGYFIQPTSSYDEQRFATKTCKKITSCHDDVVVEPKRQTFTGFLPHLVIFFHLRKCYEQTATNFVAAASRHVNFYRPCWVAHCKFINILQTI